MADKNTIRVPMWDQMQLFCKQIADHQIRLVFHFDDRLDVETLRWALVEMLKNNPIVLARLDERKNGPFWQYGQKEIDDVFSVIENDGEKRISDLLLEKIDSLHGPQMKITLLRSSNDILVLNCNHVVTDAAGLRDFAYGLAQKYTSLKEIHKNVDSISTKSRSLRLISSKLSFSEKLSILKLMSSNKRVAPTFDINISRDNVDPGFERYVLNPELFTRIKNYGKERGKSVNDMMLSLLFYALKENSPNTNDSNRITYSSDLRPFMKKEEYDVLSNFSAIHNIDVNNKLDSFDEILEEIGTLTKQRREKKYNLADFPAIGLMFILMPYPKLKTLFKNEFDKIKNGEILSAPSLSNTGVLEEEYLKFGGLLPSQAYFHGGINHPGLFQVVVSTYRKEMTLSVGSFFNNNNNNIAKVESVFESMVHTMT
jgi:NRPS condensation-like uncharacterized protein